MARLTTSCPGCGTRIDRHVSPDHPNSTPKKGDVAICFQCGMINTFVVVSGRDVRLAPIKQHEFDKLDQEAIRSLDRAMDAIRMRKQARGLQS